MEISRFSLENKIAKLTADLNKKIAADNRAFARMSKKKQRVAIAQDVLASLKSGLFKAKRGTYLDKKVNSTGTTCNVCAIGSMFAACSLRTGTSIDDLSGEGWRDNMTDVLNAYFDDEVLNVIEGAFERDGGFAYDASEEEEDAIIKYTRGLNAEKALEKIMKNIIANDGDFVLEA